jgi:heme exporter protein A
MRNGASASATAATPATGGAGHAFGRVEARGVSKVYGRERALAPLDLTLEPGDSLALLGPNGAGKSTLVGILATLVRPTTGEVLFDGRRPGAEQRGGIGVLAHDPLVYGDLSARENLRFFAALHNAPDPRVRVEELLERVGLAYAADRPARTFSRGMSQRLAIARALLHRPRLLLLDEPFTGLDRDGSATLRALLAEARAEGTALLLVTHDLEPLPGLCDRVLLLRRGRAVHQGPAPTDGAGFVSLYRDQLGVAR